MARLLKSRARVPLAFGRVTCGWQHIFGTSGEWFLEMSGPDHKYTLQMDEKEVRDALKVLQHLLSDHGKAKE